MKALTSKDIPLRSKVSVKFSRDLYLTGTVIEKRPPNGRVGFIVIRLDKNKHGYKTYAAFPRDISLCK